MAYMPKNGGQEEENSNQRNESEVRHLIKRSLGNIFFLSFFIHLEAFKLLEIQI